MYIFGEEKKRRINLGGASSATTSTSILDEARHRRLEREDRRRRNENAIRIQAWWRGRLGAEAMKVHLRQVLAQNPDEITALRCLVLLGKDVGALTRWSEDSIRKGPGTRHSVSNTAYGPIQRTRGRISISKGPTSFELVDIDAAGVDTAAPNGC
jgi:hypothetical protein